MRRVAFKMKLKSGFEAEYRKRHDEIWPELVKTLEEAGISDYSIFLDPETLDPIRRAEALSRREGRQAFRKCRNAKMVGPYEGPDGDQP